MAKGKGSFAFEEPQASGFAAIEKRKAAGAAIIQAALAMERAKVGPACPALWEPFMAAVRSYNQAEAEVDAARAELARIASRERLQGPSGPRDPPIIVSPETAKAYAELERTTRKGKR